MLDAVDERMRAKPAAGAEARIAGRRIGAGLPLAARPDGDVAPEEAPAPGLGQWSSERDLLPGSSFSLTAETGGDGILAIWGRGAVTRFDSREDDVSVGGEVATGLLGADWTRGRWTTGLVITRSRGDGGYRGAGAGDMASTLTGVWPWTRFAWGERLFVWGAAGYGDGSLTLEPRAEDGTHGTERSGPVWISGWRRPGCAAWRSMAAARVSPWR